MQRTLTILAALGFLAAVAPLAAGEGATAPKKIPAILDSDIGDDIDDTWALALALRSSELDLKLVVTDYGKREYRGKVAAKFLEVAGRTDVAVGLGLDVVKGDGGQAPWVKGYDLSKYPGKVHGDGVGALIETVMKSPEKMTLICIGPLPNIKAALEREPRIAERARFVGMHGSLRKGYGGKSSPDPEWNVKCDPAACRAALSAPWDITITPLDTCGLITLKGARYARVHGSKDPVARALMENYRAWCGNDPGRADRESSVLFDTVAVYLAITQDLCVMEKLGVRVDDKGFTLIDPSAKAMDCAMEWKDLGAFEDLLVKRLGGPAPAPASK
jgi:inosine-uridine nucleoside N-ribohydrolase